MTKTKTAKKKARNSAAGPSSAAVVWRGPIRTPRDGTVSDAITIRLSAVNALVGSANGVGYAANNTAVNTCTDWAGYAAVYDEYRVLGFQVDFLPHFPGGNGAGAIHGAGFSLTTHSADSFVGPSEDVLVQHADWKPFYTSAAFKEQWNMDGLEEAAFLNVASAGSPPLLGTIVFVAKTATSAVSYGWVALTYAVQFRGRK